MAPSPWGNAPKHCDRAADDSESTDTDQVRGGPTSPGRSATLRGGTYGAVLWRV
jgi:hypothetical protein